MPYTKEHTQQSRERILACASRLFSRRGYEAVSIDGLMQEAGMTRGAFYHHFANKSEVYAAAIAYAAQHSLLSKVKAAAAPGHPWLGDMLQVYLNRRHVDEEPSPCPLAFLVTDVSTREPEVRAAYTQVYGELVRFMSAQLSNAETEPLSATEQALAMSAMMIGAVAIGRALDDNGLIDGLLAGCRKMADEIVRA